jgi:hypothetical protein
MTELVHGKPGTYTNKKCRCDECTKAWLEYNKPYQIAWRKKKSEERKAYKALNIQQAKDFGEVRRFRDSEGRLHTFTASAFMPTPEAVRETYWKWEVDVD